MTRGHNIVADGWAGAANPHPHPMPYPTLFPTQTHTQKASKTLVCPLFDSWSRTDRRTDRRTDKASYRVACPQLKTSDAGSQYCCGWVGRGIQPPSTPQSPSHTRTYTKSIKNCRFSTFRLDHHGPTDQRTDGPMDQLTDKASYRVACPQLKIRNV